MSIQYQDVEGYELIFSVPIGNSRILELLVDQVFSCDCVWQITDPSGLVLDRSVIFKDQAHCLQDGLNKAHREPQHREEDGKAPSQIGALIEAADNELDVLRRDAERYRVLREHWVRIEDGVTVHRSAGLDLWCDERLPATKDQSTKR